MATKQTVDNLERELQDVFAFESDDPTDLFEFYHPELRENFVDTYNVCRSWLENLMFLKKLYPEHAFHRRTVYGKELGVVKSHKLRQYLNEFFDSVCNNFENVRYIEISLYPRHKSDLREPLERHRCNFQCLLQDNDFESVKDYAKIKENGQNSFQKQMGFKEFLDTSEKKLKNAASKEVEPGSLNFELAMGYSWDQSYAENAHKISFLQKWTNFQSPKGQSQNLAFSESQTNIFRHDIYT